MAEEKKITEPSDLTEKIATPKKRGRRKKSEISDTTLPSPATVEEFMNIPDALSEDESLDASAPSDEITVGEITEDISDDKNQTSEITRDLENKDEPTAADETANEEKPKRRGRRKKSEDVPVEDKADVQTEKKSSENTSENEADNGNPLSNEEIASNDTDSDMPESDTDITTEQPDTPREDESTSDVEDEFITIEHFSDTYEIKYLSEEISVQEPEDEQISEDFIEEDVEYENLKIFEDTEPTQKREPKQKRVRNIPADYAAYNAEKPRGVDARFDLVELFVYTLVIIMLITTFFFKHSRVEGESMMNTLQDGDHLIISDFLYEPKQFDIIVLHDPDENEAPIVKRIIALGGQTVRIERKYIAEKSNNYFAYYITEVYVDGEKVPDEYCYISGTDMIVPNTIDEDHKYISDEKVAEYPERYKYLVFEYQVPGDEVYVMGDHRNNSKDSRTMGSIHKEKILGQVLIRFFPFEKFGTVD